MREASQTIKLIASTLLAIPLFTAAKAGPYLAGADARAQREAAAVSGAYRVFDHGAMSQSLGPEDLADAMGVPAEQLRGAWLSGPAAGAGVFHELGVIRPWSGDSFAVLSTGAAGSPAPSPGTDLSGTEDATDEVSLTLELEPPLGARFLTFRYRFLTAEYPAFAGAGFNDRFTATLTEVDGPREIAVMAANDSRVYPVSASRARGTGFDLFTEDPAKFVTEFGRGLPAAGMTDWITVREEIRGNGPLLLEFRILDEGDNLLDSVVLLDDLSMSAATLHMAPPLAAPSPAQADPGDVLSNCVSPPAPVPVDGAVTDGETRLLVTVITPGPGEVQFTMLGAGAPDDGGFIESFESRDRLDEIQVPVVSQVAQTLFLVPDDFNRGGDAGEATREFSMHWQYIPDGDFPAVSNTITGKYKRPGVVFLHGLWSGAETWRGEFAARIHPFLTTQIADYSDFAAMSFEFNQNELDKWLAQVCNDLRGEGLGMRQADVVGHSMGGLLGRIHATTIRPGLLNKLITMNTPHLGSPWANLVYFLAHEHPNRLLRFLFRKGMELAEMPVDQGAIEDLAVGSPAISAIPQTPVPSHAMVGIGGRLFTDPVFDGTTGNACRILGFFGTDCHEVFETPEHDLIVGRDSQSGGIVPGASSTFDGFGSIHWRVTKSGDYSDRILTSSGGLLNAASGGALYGQFPAPASAQDFPATLAFESLEDADDVEFPELAVIVPVDGTEVLSGQIISVELEAPDGFVAERSIVITSVHTEALIETPLAGEFRVPLDFVGALEMNAFARNEAGEFSVSSPLFLQVHAPAELLGIEITTPDPTIASFETRRRISVSGFYADDIVRNISHPSAGTIYFSSNPSVATVSEEGVIVPIEGGFTTVVAQNSGFEDSITVRVLERDPPLPEQVHVVASPNELWPPNNQMVPVELTVTSNGGTVSGCAISQVSINEGNLSSDVEVTGSLTLDLRANRLGAGEGRLYTIDVVCSGGSFESIGSTNIRVRHDQRP